MAEAQRQAANDPHVDRAYEELRQHATQLVQAWEQLNGSRWNSAHGRGLQLAAKQLVRACERLRLSLTRKAGELETFIKVFVDTSLTPNADQLRTLSALVSTLASTALALDMVARSPAPAAAPAPSPKPTPPAVKLARVSDEDLLVLIGQPSDFGVDLAAAFLEHGYSVKAFASGEQAQALIASTLPRAIVVSANQANAIGLLRGLVEPRADLGESHRPVGFALVMQRPDLGRRLVAMRHGVKYFEPPIDPLALLVAMTGEAVTAASQSRVMILDNDRTRGLTEASWLKDAGYTVRLCTSADEAIGAIGDFKPQIAVVDADLRGAESMRTVHALRDDPGTHDVPVIVVASSRELATREQAIAGGADEYLLKPVKPRHLIGVIEARLKRSKRFAIRRASPRDDSGLYPRREFIERASSARGQNGAVVIYVALDEHDTLRKQLGISGQERLDQTIGAVFKELLRPEDVPSTYQDGRYLVLVRRPQRNDAMGTAESLREALSRRLLKIADREVALKASFGLATLDGDSADLVVQNAEAAALAAMHLGGDRSMWFENASAALVPAEREAQLRGIVESRRFGLHMEARGAPLIPLHGRVPGQYEWQLLWRLGGPGHTPASLAELQQAAREGGASGDFDRFVVGEALSVRANMLKRGKQLRLAVDLSAHALDDGGLVDFIDAKLKERRLSGTGLALTLPASTLADRIDALVAFCQHAKPLALRVGLRDIGRDMTLVHRMRGVPVDYLRLSPELSGAASDRAGEMLSALVRRAHQSGMVVIASGVDSREQATSLQAIGIDYAESPTLGPATADFNFEFSKWLGRVG